MILFVDNNAGILFLKTVTGGPIISYIFGTILGETVVSSRMIGYGPLSITINTYSTVNAAGILKRLASGVISTYSTVTGDISSLLKRWITGTVNTFSTVSGSMRGLGRILGSVYTYSTTSAKAIVTGFLYGTIETWTTVRATKPVRWITEVIKKSSVITNLFNRNSKID